MDPVEIAPLIDLGVSGVLLAVIIWFVRWYISQLGTGEQVSRRELDYTRSDRDARLAEKDSQIAHERQIASEYRAAHETSEHARELQAQQIRDLVAALQTTNRFFDAFRARIIEQRPAEIEGEGRDDVLGA